MLKDAVKQFQSQFKTEAECIAFMEEARWPNGFRCPSCDCSDAYSISTRTLPLYECKGCNGQTSLTSNTMMHKSRTPIYKWLLTIFLVSSCEGSVNAVQLSKLLQVTYKTAWSMLHKIRQVISDWDTDQLLSGDVEAKHDIYMKQIIITDERMKRERSIVVARGNNETEQQLKSTDQVASGITNAPYYKIKLIEREGEVRRALSDAEQRLFIRNCCHPEVKSLQFHVKHTRNRKFPYGDIKDYWVDGYESGDTSEKFRAYGWNAAAVNTKIKQCPFLFPLAIIATEAFRWVAETFHGIGMKYAQNYLDEYCFRMNYSWRQSMSPMSPLVCLLQLVLKGTSNLNPTSTQSLKRRQNLVGSDNSQSITAA
ncbi:transposase [Paenibacillus sp. J5C_2022]|uniref:transposase n=1 Tax=Paenibacillus sp. J5C2022 TaxID=2977129 RepID=UPI0021CED38A|nr:transposase [Paenibacillus sp. J5C2022]MCU6711132.1 transposase [Paenibacillus sp. J5C2022]